MDPDAKQMWRAALRFSAVGLELGVALVAGYLLGRWVDGKLGTSPWFMYGGLALGIATGVRAIVRVAIEGRRELDAQDKTPDEDDKQRRP